MQGYLDEVRIHFLVSKVNTKCMTSDDLKQALACLTNEERHLVLEMLEAQDDRRPSAPKLEPALAETH